MKRSTFYAPPCIQLLHLLQTIAAFLFTFRFLTFLVLFPVWTTELQRWIDHRATEMCTGLGSWMHWCLAGLSGLGCMHWYSAVQPAWLACCCAYQHLVCKSFSWSFFHVSVFTLMCEVAMSVIVNMYSWSFSADDLLSSWFNSRAYCIITLHHTL